MTKPRDKEKPKPVIRVKPHTYQPRKAEKEEIVGYEGSIDEAVKALFRKVTVKEAD